MIEHETMNLLREIAETHFRIAGQKLRIIQEPATTVPRISGDALYLPTVYNPAIPDKRALIVYTERELFKLHAKSDGRNVRNLVLSNPGIGRAARTVWNLVELHRVESFVSDLLYGSGLDIKEYNKKLVESPPENAIEALHAVKFGREDLLQGTEFEELTDDLKDLLSKVEKKSVKATHAITQAILNRLRKFKLDQYEPPTPPMSGGGRSEDNDEESESDEQNEQNEQNEQTAGGENNDREDESEEEDSESDESKEENPESSDSDEDGESEESEDQQQQDDESESDGSGSEDEEDESESEDGETESDSESDPEEDEDESDEAENDGEEEDGGSGGEDGEEDDTEDDADGGGTEGNDEEGEDGSGDEEDGGANDEELEHKINEELENESSELKDNTNRDYGAEDHTRTEVTDITETDLDKMLEEATEEGAKELQELRDKFEKTEGKEREFVEHFPVEVQGEAIVIKADVIPHSKPFKIWDQTIASELAEFFRQIRGKTKRRNADNGNMLNIPGIIARMAGDSTDELFTKRVSEHGLTIAFCIDLSGSMGMHMKFTGAKYSIAPLLDKTDPARYHLENDLIEKVTAAKYILMTLYEATRDLRDVKVRMYASNGGWEGQREYKGKRVDVFYAAELDRERIETIDAWGGSDGFPSIYQAIDDLKDEAGKKLLIYIADDDDSAAPITAAAMEHARQNGIVPYTIMINADTTRAQNEKQFRMLERKWAKRLGEPHKDFEIIDDMADAQQIITELCTEHIMAAIMEN